MAEQAAQIPPASSVSPTKPATDSSTGPASAPALATAPALAPAPAAAKNPNPTIRLGPSVLPSALPFHQSLAAQQPSSSSTSTSTSTSTSPEPAAFAEALLEQGRIFLQSSLPTLAAKGPKKSPPSVVPVEVLAGSIVPVGVPGSKKEFWCGRRSIHGGKKARGDADWNEFVTGLKENHSENERDYTPGVREAVKVCEWDSEELSGSEGWTGVEMAVFEMLHILPSPLKPRAFPILTVTGFPKIPITSSNAHANGSSEDKSSDGKSFITVTLPVDLTPKKGRDDSAAATITTTIESSKYAASTSVVNAVYTSVEHVHETTVGGEIVWEMATASDAKGVLPMTLQKLGVPGAIVKDVGLFLEWVDGRRKG